MASLSPAVLAYLKKLDSNNNREWFTENKKEYELASAHMESFADELLYGLQQIDDIETPTGKKSLYRIYRDVRFSKDKTPYKKSMSGSFKRATAAKRGGYYFHIEPGTIMIGGGFWGPNKEDLQLLREQIAQDSQPLRSVLTSQDFKANFGSLLGEQLKTAPKGFPKDHDEIDLLRYKQFIVRKDFSEKEALSEGFSDKVVEGLAAMIPFFDVMSEYLTTDLNGESII